MTTGFELPHGITEPVGNSLHPGDVDMDAHGGIGDVTSFSEVNRTTNANGSTSPRKRERDMENGDKDERPSKRREQDGEGTHHGMPGLNSDDDGEGSVDGEAEVGRPLPSAAAPSPSDVARGDANGRAASRPNQVRIKS